MLKVYPEFVLVRDGKTADMGMVVIKGRSLYSQIPRHAACPTYGMATWERTRQGLNQKRSKSRAVTRSFYCYYFMGRYGKDRVGSLSNVG